MSFSARTVDLELELTQALDRHLVNDSRVPRNLVESTKYSLLAPGKRIRPRLLLTCAEMIALPRGAAIPAALAIEMIHCYTLIHDDLPCMDDDDFRRGRPSNHKVFGEATALLAGDGLIALAMDAFLDAQPYVAPERLIAGLKRLTWAMGPRAVIAGQVAEPLLKPESPVSDLRAMHALKTGALFSASLLIPSDLAGIAENSTQGNAIAKFAAALGLAFQVADDLEDASHETGPSNITHYISEHEARLQTLDTLETGQDALRKAWGHAAEQLLAISEEVASKLRPSP